MNRLRQPETAFSLLYLTLLLGTAFYFFLPSLSRTWFTSSDEYFVVGEIMRFSHLDPHQQRFDMPGTPFMMLVAAVWMVFSGIAAALAPGVFGPTEFTFQHIDWLFRLTRSGTLLFYGVSLVLCFLLARRLINRPAACIASLLLTMSPIYARYSAFVRVESMAMCLILGAVLLLDRTFRNDASDPDSPPRWGDPIVLAGFLAGLAAGVRLHSVFVSVPLLWLTLAINTRSSRESYPRWVLMLARFGVPLLVLGGALGFFMARANAAESPHAYALLQKAALAASILTLLAVGLYFVSKLRPLLLTVAPPDAIKAGLGVAVGAIVAIPTLIPEFKGFLRAIEEYSGTYIDWSRTTWPLWKNVRWFLSFYLNVATPDRVALYLLLAGAILVAVTRDRKLIPVLGTAVIFFFSKPLNLVAAPHHIVLWLPFYAIVCAYPIGKAYSLLRGRVKRAVFVNAAFVLVLVATAGALTNGPRVIRADVVEQEVRLHNVSAATSWIKGRLSYDDTIATAFYCFNSDAFYAWLQYMKVPVPANVFDPRPFLIWWGRPGELTGRTGYACLTELDVPAFKASIPPGAGKADDPYSDPRFQPAATFGDGSNKVDVFRFDFR